VLGNLVDPRSSTNVNTQIDDRNNADLNLGRVLHTTEDFYSHSNYVELYIDYYKNTHDGTIPDPDDIPIYTDGVKDKVFKENYLDKKLHSGYFHAGKSLWITLKNILANDPYAKDEGHQTHYDLNKDNPDSREGSKKVGKHTLFDYARAVAKKHTKQILKSKLTKSNGGK
jgi:hypothetical protein